MPEYVILFGVILLFSLFAIMSFTSETKELYALDDPEGTPEWLSTPIASEPVEIFVGPGDPTGGPDGTGPRDTSNTPDLPPPGNWPAVPTASGELPLCAPRGASYNGHGYEVPGVVFNVNRPPMHFQGYAPVQSKGPLTGTIAVNVPYYQFWYPKYMGEWMYFFIYYDQWGKEIVIPPNSIQAPGSGCTSP